MNLSDVNRMLESLKKDASKNADLIVFYEKKKSELVKKLSKRINQLLTK